MPKTLLTNINLPGAASGTGVAFGVPEAQGQATDAGAGGQAAYYPPPENVSASAGPLALSLTAPTAYLNVSWDEPLALTPERYEVAWSLSSAFTNSESTVVMGTSAALRLACGKTWYTRVRALVAGIPGEWSSTASATTINDTTPPSPPASFTMAYQGVGDLRFGWSAPASTENLRDYQLIVYNNSGKSIEVARFALAALQYVWPAADIVARTAGVVGVNPASLYAEVQSRSWAGQLSTVVSASASKSAPTAPAVSVDFTGPDAVFTYTTSSDTARIVITIDGVARDVPLGRYAYGFELNKQEHTGTPDSDLNWSAVAIDGLGQSSVASSSTAVNLAPSTTGLSVAINGYYDTLTAAIGGARPRDFASYTIVVYRNSVVVDTITGETADLITLGKRGSGTYQIGIRVVDMFGQQSAQVLSGSAQLDAFTIAELRAGLTRSDNLGSSSTALDALGDDNRSSGGIAIPAGTTYQGRAQREFIDRIRDITIAMTCTGTAYWYVRTSTDGSTWRYFAGPLTATGSTGTSTTLTEVASAAAASAASVAHTALGNSTTSRARLPVIVEARIVEIIISGLGLAVTLHEFYPRRLIQTDDMDVETIRADNLGVNSVIGNKIAANAIDGKTITGATVRTAASGERVEMSGSTLAAYDSGGTAYARIRASDGFGAAVSPSSFAAGRAYKFYNPSNNAAVGGTYARSYAGTNGTVLNVKVEAATGNGYADVLTQVIGGASLDLETNGANTRATLVANERITLSAPDIRLSGGLNLGSATGAAAGEVRAPAGVTTVRTANAAQWSLDAAYGGAVSVANGFATATPFTDNNNFSGLFVVQDELTGAIAAFLHGQNVMVLIAQSSNFYSATFGTAGRVNVYDALGVVAVDNRVGATVQLRFLTLRIRAAS